jgi:hypothetical protein
VLVGEREMQGLRMGSCDDRSGYRQVDSPVTDQMLSPLPDFVHRVQFSSALTESEYRQIADLLRTRPDVALRAYGDYRKTLSSLDFLKHFPFLKRFHFNLFELKDFSGLSHLPDEVVDLAIGQFRTTKFSLQNIRRFRDLTSLFVSAPVKDAELLADFPNLRELSLTSFRFPNGSVLPSLQRVHKLSVSLGSLSEPAELGELIKLQSLSLCWVRRLRSLDWLPRLVNLKHLSLNTLSGIETLPPLGNLEQLEHVEVTCMKKLKDACGLAGCRRLRTLQLSDLPRLDPHSLHCFRSHPVCNAIHFGLNTDHRNRDAFRALGRAEEIAAYDERLAALRNKA